MGFENPNQSLNQLGKIDGAEKIGYSTAIKTVAAKLSQIFSTADAGLQAGDMDGLQGAKNDADAPQLSHYGGFWTINGRKAAKSLMNLANFAGQALGVGAPIGWIWHHYTDGIMAQLDNVGENNVILRLKNAHNPTRRADKGADFVGSGKFLELTEHDYVEGYAKALFYIGKASDFVWSGVKGIAVFWQNKVEDGLPAFRQKTTNSHSVLSDFLNGLSKVVYRFKNDVGFTRFVIESDASQTNGMMFEAKAGNIVLKSTDLIQIMGRLASYSGNLKLAAANDGFVECQTPLAPRQYSTASLPNAADYPDCIVSISDRIGKPSPLVYSDGDAWRYMDNTAV